MDQFYNLCRLCLSKPGKQNINLLHGLAENIKLFLGITINELEQDLPQKACSKCMKVLKKIRKLRALAAHNDKKLRSTISANTQIQKEIETFNHVEFTTTRNAECSDDEMESRLIIVASQLEADNVTSDKEQSVLGEVNGTNNQIESDHSVNQNDITRLEPETEVQKEIETFNHVEFTTTRNAECSDDEMESRLIIVASQLEADNVTSDKEQSVLGEVNGTNNQIESDHSVNQNDIMRLEPETENIPKEQCNGKRTKSVILSLAKRIKTEDEDSHGCEVCGKEFTSRKKYVIHKRTHTKSFECPKDECDKKFAYKTDLEKHIRVHTGEKPYKCPICKKKFSQRGTVKTHMIHLHTKVEKDGIKIVTSEGKIPAEDYTFSM